MDMFKNVPKHTSVFIYLLLLSIGGGCGWLGGVYLTLRQNVRSVDHVTIRDLRSVIFDAVETVSDTNQDGQVDSAHIQMTYGSLRATCGFEPIPGPLANQTGSLNLSVYTTLQGHVSYTVGVRDNDEFTPKQMFVLPKTAQSNGHTIAYCDLDGDGYIDWFQDSENERTFIVRGDRVLQVASVEEGSGPGDAYRALSGNTDQQLRFRNGNWTEEIGRQRGDSGDR
jgi:hypothetical protein